MLDILYQTDVSILLWVQNHLQTAFLDAILSNVTHLGDSGIIWILFDLLLLVKPKTRHLGAVMLCCLLLEYLCNDWVIKPLVHRMRPFQIYPELFPILIAPPSGYSFASGHTGSSFACVTALYGQKSPLWIPALVLASIIAFSRVYLCVHFPSDVLAGFCIGLFWGIAGTAIFRYLENIIKSRKQSE